MQELNKKREKIQKVKSNLITHAIKKKNNFMLKFVEIMKFL